MSDATRFWSKVDKSADCWLWTAGKTFKGYGTFWAEGKDRRAHRWAYELLVGPIPEGLQLDHLCRVRHCVNPAHLEPVTNRENSLRGIAGHVLGTYQKTKTHCPHGHPYDVANTYRTKAGRHCRACRRAVSARNRAGKQKPRLQG